MNQRELKQRKQSLNAVKKSIAETALSIYENNKNAVSLYEHKLWDNSGVLVVDVLEKLFCVDLNELRKRADFCPSFFKCTKNGYIFNVNTTQGNVRPGHYVIKSCDSLQVGDIVFIGFCKDDIGAHCGIVAEICGDLVTTIEWDTSYNFDINGGHLMKRNRHRSLITGVREIREI